MNIFLFGTGGHAKVVADVVERQGLHRIVGLVSEDGLAVPFDRYSVVASNADFEKHLGPLNVEGAIVALGDCATRERLVRKIGRRLVFVTAVHPQAVIDSSASIGPGTVVMAGVVVNAGAVIGSHCILNTGCSVDHDCQIGDFSHLAPGTRLAGHVSVGQGSFIGIGSSVIDRIRIGDHVSAGAGSVIVEDVPPDKKVFGVPAREQ